MKKEFLIGIILAIFFCSGLTKPYTQIDTCNVELLYEYRDERPLPHGEARVNLKNVLQNTNTRELHFMLNGDYQIFYNDSLCFDKNFVIDETVGYNEEKLSLKLTKDEDIIRLVKPNSFDIEIPVDKKYLFLRIFVLDCKIIITFSNRSFFRG